MNKSFDALQVCQNCRRLLSRTQVRRHRNSHRLHDFYYVCHGCWRPPTPSTSSFEAPVKRLLESLGEKFERQRKFNGRYVDFFLPDLKLVVEVNGTAYHGLERKQRDKAVGDYLKKAKIELLVLEGGDIEAKLRIALECRKRFLAKKEADYQSALANTMRGIERDPTMIFPRPRDFRPRPEHRAEMQRLQGELRSKIGAEADLRRSAAATAQIHSPDAQARFESDLVRAAKDRWMPEPPPARYTSEQKQRLWAVRGAHFPRSWQPLEPLGGT